MALVDELPISKDDKGHLCENCKRRVHRMLTERLLETSHIIVAAMAVPHRFGQ